MMLWIEIGIMVLLAVANFFLLEKCEKNNREARSSLNECKAWVSYNKKIIKEARGF